MATAGAGGGGGPKLFEVNPATGGLVALEPLKHHAFQFMYKSQESCWRKGVLSAVMGVVMGVGLGTFLGTFEGAHGEIIGQTTAEQLRNGFRKSLRTTWTRTKYFSANFAVIGAIYAPIECVIERERAQHDLWNPGIAGGLAGALVSVPGAYGHGPTVMAKTALRGGAGFAAMAVVFETVFEMFRG